MSRRWLIIVLLCLPAIAGQSPAARKPMLFVVHSDACLPCRTFDRIWCENPEFRQTLQDAFDVRELDWARPSEQADAIALGVRRLPSFVAVRGTRRLAMSVGFATSRDQAVVDAAIVKLMAELFVQWPSVRREIREPQPPVQAPQPATESTRVNPPPVGAAVNQGTDFRRPPDPPVATIDQTARDGVTKLVTQSRELQDAQQKTQRTVEGLQTDVGDVQTKISAVKSQVDQSRELLSQQLQQSHESTRSEISTITDRLRETIEGNRAKLPDILTEMPKAVTGNVESKDSSLLGGIAKVGIGAAALYFGLPAGVGVAAFSAISWLVKRRRKGSGHRPGTFPGITGETATAGSVAAATCNTPLPRQLDEARELLRLREREGRHPLHDALFGMLADAELGNAASDDDPDTAAAAVRLRDKVTQRFNQIAPLSTHQQDYVT